METFKELSAEQIQKALEGHSDLLSAEAEKEATFFRHSSCPQCRGTNHTPFVDPLRPFSPGSPLPKKNLRCLSCGCEFDPYTGFVQKAALAPGEVDPLTRR